MSDDLVAWLRQQIENQRHTARVLKTLAASEPSETAAFLTETADSLVADADAKRRILDRHSRMEVFGTVFCSYCCTLQGQRPGNGYWPCPEILDAAAPYAGRPGYPDERKP